MVFLSPGPLEEDSDSEFFLLIIGHTLCALLTEEDMGLLRFLLFLLLVRVGEGQRIIVFRCLLVWPHLQTADQH